MKNALHFVGFKDPRLNKDDRIVRALRIFGQPDFYHRVWDRRAVAEIVPGDTVIFAKGTEHDEPKQQAHDDSAQF